MLRSRMILALRCSVKRFSCVLTEIALIQAAAGVKLTHLGAEWFAEAPYEGLG